MGTNPSHPLAPRRVNMETRERSDAETWRWPGPVRFLVLLFRVPFRAFRVFRGSFFYFIRSFSVFLFFCGSFLFLFAVTQTPAQDVTSLESAIRTGTTEQKRDALFQIRNLRSEIASQIAVPALKDADPIVRASAASSVIFLPRPEAVTALAPLLADKDAFVRKEASYALGKTDNPDAAAPLLDLLRREKDLEVKAAVAVALGQTGNRLAIEPLLAILERSPKEDEEFVRRAAARSIGQIGQIIKTGKERVVTPQSFLPEKFKQLTGDDLTTQFPVFNPAVVTLSAVLQDPRESDDTRREAAFALGAIGSRNSVTVLENHRTSSDPYLAEIAREALAKIAQTVTIN